MGFTLQTQGTELNSRSGIKKSLGSRVRYHDGLDITSQRPRAIWARPFKTSQNGRPMSCDGHLQTSTSSWHVEMMSRVVMEGEVRM
jgi:hypothetical protein